MKHKNNLIEIELQVLNSLLQNKDILIQKAYKGNTTVFIDKDAYKENESYYPKFEKFDVQEEKHLNFTLNKEKRLKGIIKHLIIKKIVLLKVNI